MVLKISTFALVVLFLYSYGGSTEADYQFETCARIKPRNVGYIDYYPRINPGVVGSTAYVACTDRHVLRGPRTSVCQSDGTWKPDLGVCELKQEEPSENKPVQQQPIHAVILKCRDGQHYISDILYMCKDGKWRPKFEKSIN